MSLKKQKNKMNKKGRMKRVFLTLLILTVVLAGFAIWGANAVIEKASEMRIHSDTTTIPSQKVGLVLGTSKYNRNGNINLFFKYRIDAAVALYKAGKIKNIVVSGDNGKSTYNEPEDMKNELISKGIPEHVIYLDYAGFRTLDSVVRMNKIFGQTEFTIISQKFHNQRAIYIAQQYGWEVYGYNAKDVTTKSAIKVQLREKLARVKVFIDILTRKAPKFLGEEIIIS